MYLYNFWSIFYAISLCTTNSFISASQPNAITFHVDNLSWKKNNSLPPKNFSVRQKEAARIKKEKEKKETEEFNALFKKKSVTFKKKVLNTEHGQIKLTPSQLLLHEACWNNDKKVIEKLFRFPCNPNIQDSKGNTLLHIACNQKNSAIVQLLLDHPSILLTIKNKNEETAFFIACRNCSLDIVQTFLFHSTRKSLIVILLKTPNTIFKLTPWHIACMNNDNNLFSALLQTTQKKFNLPLSQFFYLVNSSDQTMLHVACMQKQADIASSLINDEANPNVTDSYFSTPLHYAVKSGCIPIIENLLKHPKIDVNYENHKSLTPLHIACIKKKSACVQLLLTHPHIIPNKFGYGKIPFKPPALHIAVMNNDVETVKILLADKRTNKTILYQGETPLRVALSNKNNAIVALLTNDAPYQI